MENTNLKRLAAMCAAAASLSTLGLAGTAMAVETPTTADTATASITLNAAQGNTLTGHTFDFYRLGSYGDITANGDKDVKSLTVNKLDTASDKWIAAANGKATKIIIPSELQNLGGVVPSIKELMTDPKDAE